MHEVSKAIINLDPNKDGNNSIDKKICGTGKWENSSASNEADGKCASGGTNMSAGSASGSAANFSKLSDMFEGGKKGNGRTYPDDATSNMGNETSKTISKDMSNLTRDQKGKVSSVSKMWKEMFQVMSKDIF